jgi:hypothetical protein
MQNYYFKLLNMCNFTHNRKTHSLLNVYWVSLAYIITFSDGARSLIQGVHIWVCIQGRASLGSCRALAKKFGIFRD